MYLPDHVQDYLRENGTITLTEIAKKEADLYVAVNVVNQQRRIINVNTKTIQSLIEQSSNTPPKPVGKRGLLKG